MTAPPVLAPAARRDITDILDHLIREAGRNVAAKYRRSLLRLFTLLGEQPGLGAPRPKLGRDIRVCIVAPYLVFYRIQRDAVVVLRILHGRRRISPALLRRTS